MELLQGFRNRRAERDFPISNAPSLPLTDFAVCAPFSVWQTGRAEAFRRGRGQRSSGGRVVQYGGSTPRPPPTLCHPIPALHPLTPPLRTGREHAHHVRSIVSHTLISAMVHPSSGRIAAQLAGRLGAARAAAHMATAASWVDARAASSLRCPLWPYPLIALVCTQHTAHCTIFLAPLGAAVPEAYGRRAVEVRFLHGPPLWDVATLSLTLTLTLTL